MSLSDGTYQLKSIAQEKQYATWFASSNKIVGNDGVEPDREWAIDLWNATFREDSTVSFEAVYHGRALGRYIAPDGKYLTLSKSAFYFSIQESHQEVYSFGFPNDNGVGSDQVWALLDEKNGTPVIAQDNTGSIQESWRFESIY